MDKLVVAILMVTLGISLSRPASLEGQEKQKVNGTNALEGAAPQSAEAPAAETEPPKTIQIQLGVNAMRKLLTKKVLPI
jgi:hypothetical protein